MHPLTYLNYESFYEILTLLHMIYGMSFSSRWEANVNDKVKGDDLRVQAKYAEFYSIFKSFLRYGKLHSADLVIFQTKAKKSCMINRQIQHLISLEVSDNFREENDFQSENESAKDDGRCLGRKTVNATFLCNWLKTSALCYDWIFKKWGFFSSSDSIKLC